MSSEYIHTYIHTVAKFANFLGPLLARSYLFTRIILSTTLAKFRQSSLWLKFPQIDKVRQIRQQNFVKSASFVTAYIKGAVCSVFPETRHSCREANLTCLWDGNMNFCSKCSNQETRVYLYRSCFFCLFVFFPGTL